MDYDRNDALLHWLFRQTQGDAWFRPNEEHISSGVALRISDVNGLSLLSVACPHSPSTDPVPEFRVFPYENPSLEPFESAVAALNPAVAVKIRSAAVHAALAAVHPDDQSVYVDANTRIQIVDTMLGLPAADKEQCAAFIVRLGFPVQPTLTLHSGTNASSSSGQTSSTASSPLPQISKNVSSSFSGAQLP